MEASKEVDQQQVEPTEEGKKQYAVIEKTAEQRKAEKEEKKKQAAEKKAAKAAAKQQPKKEESAEFVKDPNDPCANKFGDLELCRSQMTLEEAKSRVYVAIKDISDAHEGQTIRIRGRLHNSRAKGKVCFIVAREAFATVQCVMSVCDTTSKGMVTYGGRIPRESIIEIVAKVVKPSNPIDGCSCQHELHMEEVWTVNKSMPVLPFQLEDASRQVLDQKAEAEAGNNNAVEESKEKMPYVYQDTRLNNRIIDLRVPAN